MTNENLLIPKTLKVGFQKRDDTYSGKLAYVVYLNEKGQIAKEKSWNNWKSDKIPDETLENKPTEGFVLNRNVGGGRGWDSRAAKCRVWDPRGFEIEITFENLLYILSECDCTKGKGLEGEFVYAWDGQDLVLLPTTSADYKASTTLAQKKEKIMAKDLVIGASYKGKECDDLVYLGRHDWWGIRYPDKLELSPKMHLFYDRTKDDVYGYSSPVGNLFYRIDPQAMTLDKVADLMDIWKTKTWEGHGPEGITKLGFVRVRSEKEEARRKKEILDFLGTKAYEYDPSRHNLVKRIDHKVSQSSTWYEATFLHKVSDAKWIKLEVKYELSWNRETLEDYLTKYQLDVPDSQWKSANLMEGGGLYDPWTEEEKKKYKDSLKRRKAGLAEFAKNATYCLPYNPTYIGTVRLNPNGTIEDFYDKEVKRTDILTTDVIDKDPLLSISSGGYGDFYKVGVVLEDLILMQHNYYSKSSRQFNKLKKYGKQRSKN